MKFFYKMPLRLAGMILCAVVLTPVVFIASKLFPSVNRETIVVIAAFAIAASFAFPVLGPSKRKSK